MKEKDMTLKIKYKIGRRKLLNDDRKKWDSYKVPDDIMLRENIQYGPDKKWNTFDVLTPAGSEERLTVIVVIHGGGYAFCDKSMCTRFAVYLAQQGFCVLNINYRLTPEYRYPAPLEDINAALALLAEKANEWRADINNVFLTGDSAGEQLTYQYALMKSSPKYAALFEFAAEGACTVRAVAPSCGQYDLRYI